MSLPRLNRPTQIADRLNELFAVVKTRSRASLTDASHILETVARRFFNALYGWELVNLNTEQANFPAADLGDRKRRIAIQITVQESPDKITHTAAKAKEHKLGEAFDRLIVFFLLPKKPNFPKRFTQLADGPKIETRDITELLEELKEMDDLITLKAAARVLDEELGKIRDSVETPQFDISRILKYAPAELIGRETETKLLNDAWAKVQAGAKGRPHILTLVALGGEGKTSLVAKWAAELAAQDWPGCDAAFAWSFYSQGTREQLAASSDLFLKEALSFFALDDKDREFAASPAGAFEKGQRLARLVGRRRSLLILDGLEPLQYAPTSPTPGQLKDQGIAALLKGLAAASYARCVVTTRYSLPDLRAFCQTTAPEVKLLRLSRDAGVHLLKSLGVKGTAKEFETLVEDVKGHALTLTLLGGFLKRAFHGDIRQRDRVKFEKADEKMDGGHAFRTISAYEQWLLRDGGDEGRREVAVLRLMGLFDRPADAGCLAALRRETIPGLTEPLAGLADDDWEYCLSGLEAAKLLTVNRDPSGALISLDAHPHLREYFARQLRTQQPDGWRAAHQRLYEHLCATTKEGEEPTLEDLQPLYQAVAHGCQAGATEEARAKVYRDRIQRGREAYSAFKLGAFGSDLGAITCFFEHPWNDLVPGISESGQGWLLNEAAFTLRALGRLTESLGPMRAGVEMARNAVAYGFFDRTNPHELNEAARQSSNLSELELTLGELAGAVGDAKQSVNYVDRSDDFHMLQETRCTHADALHQAGDKEKAETRFREAEELHAKGQPDYPLLYSVRGFKYCDLLLATPERSAWQRVLESRTSVLDCASPLALSEGVASSEDSSASAVKSGGGPPHSKTLRAVSQRAAQTLKWGDIAYRQSHLDISLDHLTLGRAALYAAILEGRAGSPLPAADNSTLSETERRARSDAPYLETAHRELDAAVDGLRRAGTTHHIPRGLLTRAWLRFLTGTRTSPESAQEDLDEAWEIAERGPMRLFMVDIHLYRARLFFREAKYPWESPADDLKAAEELVNKCGYHRRDEELADAKRSILGT
jgi:hypothetical protein